MWGGALIKSWSSTQSTIALSSAEAELYAMSRCAQQALSLVSLASDFGIKMLPTIHSDASAAIGVAFRSGLSGRMRHVKVQYLWIQEAIQKAEVSIKKIRSQDNPADLFTKFLSSELTQFHTCKLGIRFPRAGEPKDPVRERIRCFAKHLALAEQHKVYLAHLLGESGQGGVTGFTSSPVVTS